jgi:adenylosuccinate synthase
MLDQKFPEMRDRGVNGPLEQDLAERVTAYLTDVQKQIGAEIKMVTTGPNTASWM